MQDDNQSKPARNGEDELDLSDKVKIEQERLKVHPSETDAARDYRLRLQRMSEIRYLGKEREKQPIQKHPESGEKISKDESDRLFLDRMINLSKKHYGIRER